MSVKLVGDWRKAGNITRRMTSQFQRASKVVVNTEAQLLKIKMIEGLKSGSPGGKRMAATSPTTLAVRKFKGGKGGSRPMDASGGLRRSLQVKKLGQDVFVGVVGSKGGAKYAQMLEDGAVFSVKITKRSRRFLMAVFRKFGGGPARPGGTSGQQGSGGTSIAIIRIPPRPFIAPVVEKEARPSDVKKRANRTLAAAMAFQLGKV